MHANHFPYTALSPSHGKSFHLPMHESLTSAPHNFMAYSKLMTLVIQAGDRSLSLNYANTALTPLALMQNAQERC